MNQVYIGQILAIDLIENADRIVQATVFCGTGGTWKGVVEKGQFQVGDICEVYLQDSILPEVERFNFLSRKRIKIAKFRGAYSECLIMPLSFEMGETFHVGDDITERMQVTKYEKPVPLNANITGRFPSFIPKTDEPNFQRVPELVQALQGQAYYVTQKLDGTSITLYNQNSYHVCSRNYTLQDTGLFNAYKTFPEGYAIQMEYVGPGIQSNPLELKARQGFVFNVYEIATRRYLDRDALLAFTEQYGLSLVPTLQVANNFDADDNRLREMSVGAYPNGKPQEGIVIRPFREQVVMTGEGEKRLSFKVVNAEYKG